MPDNDPRQTSTEKRSTRDRIAGYRREENLPGGVDEIRPNQSFHIIGFDIASAALNLSIQNDLNRIIQYIKLRDDINYRIVITGTASESRIQQFDNFDLGQARADAIAAYFRSKGIPSGAILTFSHGSVGAAPATSSPEVKAEYRGAFIDIKFSGTSRRQSPKPNAPAVSPDPNKDISNATLILPPDFRSGKPIEIIKEADKKLKQIANYFIKLNKSGSDQDKFNAFTGGWAEGLATLTEKDPVRRELTVFKKLRKVDLEALENERIQALHHLIPTARVLDDYKIAGKRFAYDQIRGLGPDVYSEYARKIQTKYPSYEIRKRAYFNRGYNNNFDLDLSGVQEIEEKYIFRPKNRN